MKILHGLVLLFIACHTLNARGQSDSIKTKPSGYISLNAGYGAPIEPFNAMSGIVGDCNIQYPVYKNTIGIAAKIAFGGNRIDDQLYNYLVTNSNATYYHGWLMAGVYYNVLKKNVMMNVHFLMGAAYVNCPEIETCSSMSGVSGYGADTTDMKKTTVIAVGYNIGIGIIWTPYERFSVTLSADYYNTYDGGAIKVTEGEGGWGPPIYPTGSVYTHSDYSYGIPVNIDLFCVSIGCAYRLTK